MNIRVLVASALALAVIAPATANALTIDNKDKAAYTVKIIPKGGKEMDVALKATASADVDCKMGCKVSLGNSTENVTGKTTKLMIKDGKLAM